MYNAVPIRSVSRTISVLQAINRHGSLSMMAIAKNELLPYPTAYRIVQTLLHEGLIEQEPTRKHYRPTALVQSLAHGYEAQGRLVDYAGPIIRGLTREVGWPVFVTEQVGARMVVRDATHAETTLTYGPCHPGFSIPLVTSATGQAWIAYLAEEELDHVIQWHNPSDLRMDARAIAELKLRLAQIRADGYSAKACLNTDSNRSASIAAPVLENGKIKAVVTLIYFQSAMKECVAIQRYADAVRSAAAQIEKKLADAKLV
jgi:IclR family mhp operon transcriptional activator